MSQTVYDALVIGSGAAGSFAAKELTAQGLSVLLLEAGRAVTHDDFDPARKKAPASSINIWERARATIKGQPIQARAAFFTERFSHFFVNDRKNPYTTPRDAPFLWIRGRQAGGRLHSFGRVLLRWTDDDFKIKSRTGKGVDWPISYDELEPYYNEVESCLGLYGNEDGVETLPDGVYAHPAGLTPAEEIFKADVEARWPERRVVSWRYVAPDAERTPKPLREAQATGRLTIRHNAIVRRITTDDGGGQAAGAEFIDAVTGKVEIARAALVVLSASPIESVRLLLNSVSARHPEGLGNRSGTLGRYFMDQLPCLAFGSFQKAKGWAHDASAPTDPFYNPSGGIFIPRFGKNDPSRGDFDFQGSVGRAPTPDNQPSRLAFFGFGRMLPYADNRITLDVRRKDAWNIPVPHIRCAMHDEEHALLAQQEKTMIDLVHTVGGELEFIGSPAGLREMGRGAFPDADPFSRFMFRRWFGKTMCMGAAIHETGGARMGDTPENSVLNPYNQLWDAPNVIVADASAFPGSGIAGTTLTVMALTIRACRNLIDQHRTGRV
ncbi:MULTISPECIES: GMC family oxidoreductase [unclassified Rhizobium]|uniref:GMC oxidoreductase n=1 Tax=unclassified Rhizobium TaxID=2613769 RepID=UPI001048A0FA|nr:MULTISPECIES: GMC family oxidoreductase [unclassified Rhizobium]MBB3395460.1 choline dehydrogenase-like flavoprotein [Rhizobium sp. BK060]TCM75162.1 choline dehydrogenase-like flavoprotein [Rhizobium sp. BK068]